ncbi:hypothetical protein AB6A40_001488 [Gnathostoma spinigerum]|uniref:Secreted protein n=1 Tax=Gnathostoma spinigerum TaxID=75299 RepID=A0ABD6EBQ3_9BILA
MFCCLVLLYIFLYRCPSSLASHLQCMNYGRHKSHSILAISNRVFFNGQRNYTDRTDEEHMGNKAIAESNKRTICL